MWYTINSTVHRGAPLWLIDWPDHGRREARMVYERWTDPDSDFEKVRVTSDMCPRLTAGAEETQEGQIHRVAKTILISRLEAAMHAKELHVAAELSEAETLREEL